MKVKLAPIILFTYNRPQHTEQTLYALMLNELASESELYIYCDGPKENATDQQKHLITEVREVIRKRSWCKNVHIIESKVNKGLANSIIDGVTEVINKHGKVIVLEDDIVTSVGFLKYMNDALNFYENEEKVMHISAYMYPHKEKLPETFFFNVPYPGGGWATWQRAWKYFNNDANYLYSSFQANKKWDLFNKFGGRLLQKQLKANIDGQIKTWFVKWHAVLIMHGGFTLYPNCSLTNNIGFDDSATHCVAMTKFDIDNLAEKIEVKKIKLKESKKATRIILHFYQGNYYFIRQFFIRSTPEWLKPTLKNLLNFK
jgi:hypothetical protein